MEGESRSFRLVARMWFMAPSSCLILEGMGKGEEQVRKRVFNLETGLVVVPTPPPRIPTYLKVRRISDTRGNGYSVVIEIGNHNFSNLTFDFFSCQSIRVDP